MPEWEIQGDTVIACHSEATVITVPDGIREIGPNAFRKMEKLEVIVLPDTVEIIGTRAFAECPELRQVVLSRETTLKEIGEQAFLNCKKLDTGFVPEGVKVAENAFEGIDPPTPGPTAEPTATPTAEPTPGPTAEPTAAPTAEPTPTPTAAPTAQPSPAPTEAPTAEPTEEPTDEPTEEPEDAVPYIPRGGGGSYSGLPQGHARSTLTTVAEYDLVSLKDIPAEGTAAMNRLTLGGEELALTLEGVNAEAAAFTVAAMHWPEEEEAPETPADTLILTATEAETEGTWKLNGAVLRRMYKSGISHLALRTGDRIAVMETEGFLAGWMYDELKSRGTANRRFEYEVTMSWEEPAAWKVTIEDEPYELTADDHAGIYLTGAYSAEAEALERPYVELRGENAE